MGGHANITLNISKDLERYAKNGVLDVLLKDHSTGKNIVWATSAYVNRGIGYEPESEITPDTISKNNLGVIKTRAEKAAEEQASLTKSFAEVFTPTWVCKYMIDEVESANALILDSMNSIQDKRKYIRTIALEITCGEAPFITNRYDAADGVYISFEKRTGILDRKLRVVQEIATSFDTWKKWAFEALRSVYGYEYQGDNLFIARLNVLRAVDEAAEVAGYSLATATLKRFAETISHNFFQMDGLTYCVPFKALDESYYQPTLFDFLSIEEDNEETADKDPVFAKIINWQTSKEVEFRDLRGEGTAMKFDFIIGNPPYQEEGNGNKTFAPPVYHKFMDGAYEVSDRVELIHPARFLFDAGSTPKAWNRKMLNDPHFKVLMYEADCSKIFPNQDIKGGVAVTYRDAKRDFGAIRTFTPFPELASILKKAGATTEDSSLASIIYTQNKFNLDQLYNDYPSLARVIGSNGKDKRFRNNIFDKIPLFVDKKEKNYLQILGIQKNKRVWKYIDNKYVDMNHENISKWKVFVPRANGSGALGEVLSTPLIGQPLIGQPLIGHTQSFISIGKFETKTEAEACLKYVKSKFARVLLGVLKVTQDNDRGVWRYIPLQDFTSMSDIDWSQSISDIDKQLYAKYGLDEEEINFIETHVKEMD